MYNNTILDKAVCGTT